MSFHALRFNRSAAHYEDNAAIQSRMAARLLELWDGSDPANILELGCGTGILTRRMREKFPAAHILATDTAPAMLAEARQRCEVSSLLEFSEQDAQGFAEAVPAISAHGSFDTIASNALVQWFPDLERHLRFTAMLTGSGGVYLLSGFSNSNFPELNSLLSEPPFSYKKFPGHDPESIRVAADRTGWKSISLWKWEEQEILPSPEEVLHRIQSLGSSRDPREGGRLNQRNLGRLLSAYENRFSESGGVRLTWKPWVALLKRS